MLRSTILLVVCSALVAAIPHSAHISQHFTADDEYIVTYKDNTTEAIRTAHLHSVQATGAQVTRRFDFSTFHGFAVRIPAGANPAGRALLASPYVAHVERSQIFRATSDDFEDFPPAVCKVQQNASWGLVRRNKAELEIDGLYSYNALRAGQNTYAFIVDSGIYLDHFDFGDRAVWGYDAVEDPSPHDDTYGHGTFVAGIVGGREWGAAKNVTLVAVRVLNQAGVGSTSGIIAGLQYVATTGAGNRSVALLAISGATSTAINNAVAAVTAVGIPVVVSAGNAGIDACSTSPASESTAIRVAASDSLDRWYPSNNYGSCVDIIAPGVDISSAYIGNAFSQNTLTGTSMAAAAVAGSLANILSGFPPGGLGPSFARSYLLGNAANGTISGVPANTNTTNLLLQDPCF